MADRVVSDGEDDEADEDAAGLTEEGAECSEDTEAGGSGPAGESLPFYFLRECSDDDADELTEAGHAASQAAPATLPGGDCGRQPMPHRLESRRPRSSWMGSNRLSRGRLERSRPRRRPRRRPAPPATGLVAADRPRSSRPTESERFP